MQKKSSETKYTEIIILSIILVILILFSALLLTAENHSTIVPDMPIAPVVYENQKTSDISSTINLALFGIDTRKSAEKRGDRYRSDSIMVASLDVKNNKIKLISIMRDSKVPIEGYEPQKINAAYKYGGEELAIRTINENFGLELEDFITVDFGEMQKVIDVIGGIDVELTQAEADMVNDYAEEVFGYTKKDAKEGANLLNGAQAVSYSRIRYLDSDYYRVSRQQKVLNAILEKIKTVDKSKYPSLVYKLFTSVNTSLSFFDLLNLVDELEIKKLTFESYTVPDYDSNPELWGGIDERGEWVWIYDLKAASRKINEIIGNGKDTLRFPERQNGNVR